MKRIYLQAIGIWFLLAVVANINGTIRNFIYGPFVPELTAHQISCLTGALLFGITIFMFLKRTRSDYTNRDLFGIGTMWLLMTICFEFVFGHFVIGHSWERLFHDYNMLEGRLWALILLWTWISPMILGRLASWKLSLPDRRSDSSPDGG